MFNNRQPPEQQTPPRQQEPQQQQSVGPRRGMTPRMLELSRRLSDIEFHEYIPTAPPVVSPSAFSRQGGRKRGSIAGLLSAGQQQQQKQATSPHMGLLCAGPPGRAQSPPRARAQRALLTTAIREEDEAVQLRDRLRVPASGPSRLGGLELVEPAKVDTLYAEDRETSEY
ncbi:hypothetical protein H4R19_002946, partial [Coemansia spiralis]